MHSILLIGLVAVGRVNGFVSVVKSARRSVGLSAHWMDYLKFDNSPQFDVIQRTQDYLDATSSAAKNKEYMPSLEEYFAQDYVFRGAIIGPMTRTDVAETQKSFDLIDAFPDLDRGIFGLTIDPQNPYRVFIFERWTATMTGDAKLGPFTLPATQKRVQTPVHITSITWNPQGKIVYESLSPPLDRFEGNTMGSGAVFGLLAAAGVQPSTKIGDPFLIAQQKLVSLDAFGGILGKTWSDDKHVPDWWKSKARGAQSNDI